MREEPTITTTPQEWRALAERLKAEGYDQLCDLTCVDWYPEPLRFEVVCQLHDTKQSRFVRIKTRCDAEAPPPTLIPVWPSANWFEREAFDLYGIVFEGHSDLRRILTDYGFVGHPFRKDFPVSGHVEMRYDAERQRVVYEPVSIEPRDITPRIIREDKYGAGV